MTRDEAIAVVQTHITLTDEGYKAVSVADARRLIGDKHFERLLTDRIRNQGPLPGTLYWWNVVDYFVVASNEREAIRLDEDTDLKSAG